MLNSGVSRAQVLLTEDGRAKIADMGMSRSQIGTDLVSAQAVMTPIWSAPEVRGPTGSRGNQRAHNSYQDTGCVLPFWHSMVMINYGFLSVCVLYLPLGVCMVPFCYVFSPNNEGRPSRHLQYTDILSENLFQVVNKERTNLAADIWSLGMLVWELSTGLDITVFPPLSVTSQVMGDRVGYDG